MKDAQIHVRGVTGSLEALRGTPDGEVLVSQPYPYMVRSSVSTAAATLTGGTETDLLAGVTGEKHDLLFITGANNSTVAVTVSIREATANAVVMSLELGANSTEQITMPIPYPQQDEDSDWTVDIPDISGTTVTLAALFITT